MSAGTLRDRVRSKFGEKIDGCIQIMMAQQFRPASVGHDGEVLPANTLDEIAVKTIECNAMARAYKYAIDVLDEEYKRLVDPRGDVPESEQPETDSKEGLYG